MTDDVWHFYKLYVGSHQDALDFLIVDGLEAVLEEFAPASWFFLRYIDEGGVHLRLRFRFAAGFDTERERQLYVRLNDALSMLPQRPPPNESPLISFNGMPSTPGVDLGVQCVRAQYEPELDVFGGPIGVRIAEDVFCASSMVARDVLLRGATGGSGRKDIALPLFKETLNAYVPATGTRTFLDRYTTYWLAGNPDTGHYKAAFAEKAYELLDEGVTVLPRAEDYDAGLRAAVEPWRAALRRSHERYKLDCPRYTPALADTVAFYFIHLMNNRLGFSVLEEAYLAVLLTKTIEIGHVPA